jgi:hypothetical protein
VTDDNRALLDMEDLEDFGMASSEEVRDVLRAVHVAISEGYSQETEEGGPTDGRVVFALPSLPEVLEVLEHVEEVRRREAEEKMEKNSSSRDDVEEHKDQEQPKESSKSRCTCS